MRFPCLLQEVEADISPGHSQPFHCVVCELHDNNEDVLRDRGGPDVHGLAGCGPVARDKM
jgi:hypothetical protein